MDQASSKSGGPRRRPSPLSPHSRPRRFGTPVDNRFPYTRPMHLAWTTASSHRRARSWPTNAQWRCDPNPRATEGTPHSLAFDNVMPDRKARCMIFLLTRRKVCLQTRFAKQIGGQALRIWVPWPLLKSSWESDMDLSSIGSSLGSAEDGAASHPRRDCNPDHRLDRGSSSRGPTSGCWVAQLNRRIADTTEQKLDLESGVATAAFWLIILITLIGVFNSLDLALASGPFEVLVKQIAVYVPHSSRARSWCSSRGSSRSRCAPGQSRRSMRAVWTRSSRPARACSPCARASATCSTGWSFCCSCRRSSTPTTLGGLLDPVRVMVAKTLDMLPNVFAAFVIGFVGWLLGKVLAGLVTNILAAAGADRPRTDWDSTQRCASRRSSAPSC